MLILHKIALPSINAIFITLGLLYAMFLLVNIAEPELIPKQEITGIDFVRIPEETPLITKIAKPKAPQEVETPPRVLLDNKDIERDINPNQEWGNPYENIERTPSLFNLADSQLVLAIGFPPEYPRSAITRGVEGYAVVGFSVDRSGAVYDAYIIESEPNTIFDRSALKAIMKFKYKARMIDGKPVTTDSQRYMFTYKMDS